MQSSIREEVALCASLEGMGDFLKDLFPIGDPSKITDIFISSLSDRSPEGVYELLLSCRNDRRSFAKWIFKCISLSNTSVSDSLLNNSSDKITDNLSESLQSMTAISPGERVADIPSDEEAFILFCLSSKAFLSSWRVLRSSIL